MAQLERIQLFRGENAWMARSSNPELVRLFGTDTIPTAFTTEANATEVRHRIQELNPNAQVEVLLEGEE